MSEHEKQSAFNEGVKKLIKDLQLRADEAASALLGIVIAMCDEAKTDPLEFAKWGVKISRRPKVSRAIVVEDQLGNKGLIPKPYLEQPLGVAIHSQVPMTRGMLDSATASCGLGHEAQFLYLHGKCHPGGKLEVSYEKGTGVVRVGCKVCARDIVNLSIASDLIPAGAA